MKPGLHVQLCPPLMLLHTAWLLQSCVPAAHSLMSKKQLKLIRFKDISIEVDVITSTQLVSHLGLAFTLASIFFEMVLT